MTNHKEDFQVVINVICGLNVMYILLQVPHSTYFINVGAVMIHENFAIAVIGSIII